MYQTDTAAYYQEEQQRQRQQEDDLLHQATGTMVQFPKAILLGGGNAESVPRTNDSPLDSYAFGDWQDSGGDGTILDPANKPSKKKGGGGSKSGGGGGSGGKLLGPGAIGKFRPLPNVPASQAGGGPSPILLLGIAAIIGVGAYLVWHKLHKAKHEEDQIKTEGET